MSAAAIPSEGLTEALDRKVLHALRVSKIGRVDARFRAFKRSGADRLLVAVFREGRLTRDLAQAELKRWQALLAEDPTLAADIKEGFRVFDGLAQRLSLAGAPLEYSYKNNGPRDLLSAFASSLHR